MLKVLGDPILILELLHSLTSSMSPPKICIVGDNCVDLYPVQTKKFVGGNGVNTAVAVQRNGIHCGYLGIVGNDETGNSSLKPFKRKN